MNINAHWIYKQQKNAWDKNAWKNEKTVIWTQENSRKKTFCCNCNNIQCVTLNKLNDNFLR